MPSLTAPTALLLRRSRLRAERRARGLSQAALAELAGTSQPIVSLAERGSASTPMLARLARALGFTGEPRSLLDTVEFEAARSTPAPPTVDSYHRDAAGRFASPTSKEEK